MIKNKYGKTVGIRIGSPEDFDEALAQARRLFYSVEQVGDKLVSAAAWPHANPTNPEEEPEEKTVPRLGSTSASGKAA